MELDRSVIRLKRIVIISLTDFYGSIDLRGVELLPTPSPPHPHHKKEETTDAATQNNTSLNVCQDRFDLTYLYVCLVYSLFVHYIPERRHCKMLVRYNPTFTNS